jgi:hypothetical protein
MGYSEQNLMYNNGMMEMDVRKRMREDHFAVTIQIENLETVINRKL